MSADQERPGRRTVIGGRHGSPTVTVALPFSNIVNVDAELRDAIADLATLVARLAAHSTTDDAAEMGLVREAAEELAARLSSQGG
jgi:hypothetical protein